MVIKARMDIKTGRKLKKVVLLVLIHYEGLSNLCAVIRTGKKSRGNFPCILHLRKTTVIKTKGRIEGRLHVYWTTKDYTSIVHC